MCAGSVAHGRGFVPRDKNVGPDSSGSDGEVACFGSDGGVSERPLPPAGCASLRAAGGRACVGSLGYLQAVPLDTWIHTAIEEHYPDCERGNYEATSRAVREQFGGEYAGYAQTYVFHYLRGS